MFCRRYALFLSSGLFFLFSFLPSGRLLTLLSAHPLRIPLFLYVNTLLRGLGPSVRGESNLQPLFWYSQNTSFCSVFILMNSQGSDQMREDHILLSFFLFSEPLTSFYIPHPPPITFLTPHGSPVPTVYLSQVLCKCFSYLRTLSWILVSPLTCSHFLDPQHQISASPA